MSSPECGAAPLGLFGGTFDPVHRGHLRLAEQALATLGLARVIWCPAGRPPHREPARASAADRLAMVEAAVAGNPAYAVDPSEVLSAAPSYTVRTLERLRAESGPDRPLVLLLGGDAFAGLDRWHRWQDLFALAHIAVTHRAGHSAGLDSIALPPVLAAELSARRIESPAVLASSPAGRIIGFAMTPFEVSATKIRGLLAGGRDTGDLLPLAVVDYIRAHRLYRDGHPDPQE